MTNREKYAEEILDIACNYGNVAVSRNTNKLVPCNRLNCCDCLWVDNDDDDCDEARKQWSEQEYTKPPVDWNKVKVDTPILVKDHSGASWVHRHFARYSNGVVHAWIDGKTSWTEDIVNEWNFAKLAESRVNDH